MKTLLQAIDRYLILPIKIAIGFIIRLFAILFGLSYAFAFFTYPILVGFGKVFTAFFTPDKPENQTVLGSIKLMYDVMLSSKLAVKTWHAIIWYLKTPINLLKVVNQYTGINLLDQNSAYWLLSWFIIIVLYFALFILTKDVIVKLKNLILDIILPAIGKFIYSMKSKMKITPKKSFALHANSKLARKLADLKVIFRDKYE